MRVALFVTCLVEHVWPEVGACTVRLLRRLGCEVRYDPRLFCCGQPAFNAGYVDEARAAARSVLDLLDGEDAVVLPSGSCTAMIRHFAELFADDPGRSARAAALAERTFELSSFLVRRLGVEDVGARFKAKLSWHDACHGLRELGIRPEPRWLLARVREATLIEAPTADACCGFGGTFSVRFPEISVAMADRKLDEWAALRVDAVVSGDVSCLMQLRGRASRRGLGLRTL